MRSLANIHGASIGATALVVAFAGCTSSYRAVGDDQTQGWFPTDCPKALYFEDADDDGWGTGTGKELCGPGEPTGSDDTGSAGFTAVNDLDCNDDDGAVTGQLGALCPQDFLAFDATPHVGALAGDSEFVAALEDAGGDRVHPPVLPATASFTCHAWGDYDWRLYTVDPLTGEIDTAGSGIETGFAAGGLATFENAAEVSAVTNAIEPTLADGQGWAGWIGLVWDDEVEDWVWEEHVRVIDGVEVDASQDGDPFDYRQIPFCNPSNPPDPVNKSGQTRLALVRPADPSSSWCLGLASDAGLEFEPVPDGEDPRTEVDDRHAYFLCERAAPSPSYRITVGEGASGATATDTDGGS